jgi:hypothetical protein
MLFLKLFFRYLTQHTYQAESPGDRYLNRLQLMNLKFQKFATPELVICAMQAFEICILGLGKPNSLKSGKNSNDLRQRTNKKSGVWRMSFQQKKIMPGPNHKTSGLFVITYSEVGLPQWAEIRASAISTKVQAPRNSCMKEISRRKLQMRHYKCV